VAASLARGAATAANETFLPARCTGISPVREAARKAAGSGFDPRPRLERLAARGTCGCLL